MAVREIKGKNVRLILDGKKVYHATDCGISLTREMESLSSKDTNGAIQSPGAYSWSATLSALVAEIDPVTSTHHSFKDIWEKALDGSLCEFQYTTSETGDMLFSGQVYITQADFSAPTTGAATGSFSFTGNGDLTLSVVEA
jgi:hypothetical protein